LTALLQEGNVEAEECLKALKEYLPGTEFAEAIARLEGQVDNYNFEAAREILTEIAASLNISLNINN